MTFSIAESQSFDATRDSTVAPPCPRGGEHGRAGEGGIIAVGGVMANAVANALGSLGVEPRQLPLTPSYIWELVQQARVTSPRRGEVGAEGAG